MIQVLPNLSYGPLSLCQTPHTAIIHACKDPCHKVAVGYSGALDKQHPHYLIYRRGNHLYLNMIDSYNPLFYFDLFRVAQDFIEEYIGKMQVIVHCNGGVSRSPSIVLHYMVRNNLLPKATYREAALAFQARYPYNPGIGIQRFFAANWSMFID